MKGHKYNLRPRQSLKNPTFFRYLHEDNFPYLTAELERKTPQSDTESEDTTSTDTFTYFTSPSSDEEDMETVANMLGLPESDDLDIAATIYRGDDLDALQIERHTFDPLGRPELDVAGFRTPSGQEIIPFPL